MNRRQFVGSSSLIAASYMLPSWSNVNDGLIESPKLSDMAWSKVIPPLFCTAYIDPGIDSQKGQEKLVAKYPLALVPQDDRRHFVRWRDTVKNINPDIKMLAYQMVIEETTVPGPGHDRMRKLKDAWITYPGGWQPKVSLSKNKERRIYDPIHRGWKEAFIDACSETLESYPYDGLLLDQCSIFNIASPTIAIRNDMLDVLRTSINELRLLYPKKIIIANSSYSFDNVNGELNENREKDLSLFRNKIRIHTKPEMNLYQLYTQDLTDLKRIKAQLKKAQNYQLFFGVSSNYQKIEWFDFFDDIIYFHGQRAL